MADHLMTQTLPTTQVDLATYYQQGTETADRGKTAPEPRKDMNPAVAARLGIDQNKSLGRDEIANLLQGRRADGKAIEGKSTQKATENKSRNGYIDLCWSADKSVSIAWALAPTEAERNIIMQAHRDAVDSAMTYVEKQIGHARKGMGGSKGEDKGSIGWIKFDHYTSRSTIAVRKDEHGIKKLTLARDNESRDDNIEIIDLKVPGDMNLHTHVAVPNMVLTDDGRVGALDFHKLQGRIHEFGAVYQAFIAENLRRSGIDVTLDEKNGSARITAIPETVRDAFSKRTRDAHEMARGYAQNLGADWDNMSDGAKIKLLKSGAKGSRQTKVDDLSDMEAWRKQAADLRWEPKSVIQDISPSLDSAEQRLEKAYDRALPFLEDEFSRRSVLSAPEARVAAARGLIAAGIDTDDDIGAVTAIMRQRGVQQEGKQTELVWGQRGDSGDHWFITTGLHISQEKELIRLAKDASADKGLSLTCDEIDNAVKMTDLVFNSDHGRNQRNLMEQIGTGGKVAVGIGIAGSGKTAVLQPLVKAWKGKGIKVFGTALAWKQSEGLSSAGIDDANRFALAAFIARAKKSQIELDGSSVVVVDELGQIGTRQLLDMMRLQKKHGFKLVAVGDDKQCQSIEAGPVIELMRKALGKNAVPELLTTIRQEYERDRAISILFRDGKADKALEMKNEDGTVILEPGGHREAIQRVAELWDQRRKANHNDPSFTITVSAPTNADAREISTALREKRRAVGEVEEDKIIIAAQDQHNTPYQLPLAIGDRVRLFDRVNASFGNRGGVIGSNGSVLSIVALDKDGLTLRAETGIQGKVKWNTLRDHETGRIRLTYGDAGTIDSQQGITSTEHIDALPSGSKSVQGFKAYVAESRHRRKAWMVTSDSAERQEVVDRRPLGDARIVSDADIWENMSRNLSRQPEKLAAVDFLGMANNLRRTALHAMQSGLQRKEQREVEGKEPTTFGSAIVQAQEVSVANHIAGSLSQAAETLSQHTKKEHEFDERLMAFEQAMASVEDHVEDIASEHLLEAIGAGPERDLPDAPDWADDQEPVINESPNEPASVAPAKTPARAPAKVSQKPLRHIGKAKKFEPIPKDHLDALKERVRLSEIVSQSVKLDRAGHDFKGCCPFHDEKTPSFHVSDKRGTFTCFGCGEHGDVLDFLQKQHGLKFHDAIKQLEDRSGISLPEAITIPRVAAPKGPEWKPVFPVPADAPSLMQASGKTARIFNPKQADTPKEWAQYRPAHVASYQDVDGQQVGYVIRVEIKDKDARKDRKFTPQVTWVVPANSQDGSDPAKIGRWALWPMPDPRPLYHAEMLLKNPDAPVIVVTGEKKADALQKVMGDDAVVVSWAGGDNARQYVDFKPLADRDVIVWPDADQSGIDATLGKVDRSGRDREGSAKMIDDAGAAKVRVLMPPEEVVKGWDCGDFVKEGATKADVQKLIADRSKDRLELERQRIVKAELDDTSIDL
jgi:hypothetical protein